MDKNNMNISNVEEYIYQLIRNKVSKHIFPSLPDTIDSRWNDMCWIDCGNGFQDFDAFGKGTILIWLYAKPREDGSKNVTTMSKLEKNLNDAIAQSKSKIYQINRGKTYCDFDATRGWHCNIVELNILIF